MKKIEKRGSHIYMSPEEISKWHKTLEDEHKTYLEKYGVKFYRPGVSKALWLIYLKKYERDLVHKDTISAFIQSINPKAGKDQQVRHLASDGWYVLNKGDKIPGSDKTVPSGYHMLVTTENPKPTFLFKSMKRAGRISAKNFKGLKITYDNRCATCGSQEGKPHFIEPDKRTELHQGHMNPHKALSLENSIPQCQICNAVYQDDYVFNEKGRVVAVASPRPVLKAEKQVIEEIKKALK